MTSKKGNGNNNGNDNNNGNGNNNGNSERLGEREGRINGGAGAASLSLW
jgi:hypothetical protein